MSHKPLHHQQLTIAQKQVYNNAGRQGNKKGNCLVGRRGVGWVSVGYLFAFANLYLLMFVVVECDTVTHTGKSKI